MTCEDVSEDLKLLFELTLLSLVFKVRHEILDEGLDPLVLVEFVETKVSDPSVFLSILVGSGNDSLVRKLESIRGSVDTIGGDSLESP